MATRKRKRNRKTHAVFVYDCCVWPNRTLSGVSGVDVWIATVGMDLDGDGTTKVIVDFEPAVGELVVIRQTENEVGKDPDFIWTRVEDE